MIIKNDIILIEQQDIINVLTEELNFSQTTIKLMLNSLKDIIKFYINTATPNDIIKIKPFDNLEITANVNKHLQDEQLKVIVKYFI